MIRRCLLHFSTNLVPYEMQLTRFIASFLKCSMRILLLIGNSKALKFFLFYLIAFTLQITSLIIVFDSVMTAFPIEKKYIREVIFTSRLRVLLCILSSHYCRIPMIRVIWLLVAKPSHKLSMRLTELRLVHFLPSLSPHRLLICFS